MTFPPRMCLAFTWIGKQRRRSSETAMHRTGAGGRDSWYILISCLEGKMPF